MSACIREKEVVELVERGQWLDGAAPERSGHVQERSGHFQDLRDHVAGCESCAQVLLLTQSFRQDRAQAIGAARLQSPGVLWWRAQLRRRNAALEKIGRPLLGAQIFAVAVSLIAALGVLAFEAEKGQGWRSWMEQMPHSLHLEALLPTALQTNSLWVTAAVVAMLALVTGVIAWVAAEKQ